MNQSQQNHRIEITFNGAAPRQTVERASGVSDVEIEGSTLRCHVRGSFQPFLEALRGYEVTTLESRPALDDDSSSNTEGGRYGTV